MKAWPAADGVIGGEDPRHGDASIGPCIGATPRTIRPAWPLPMCRPRSTFATKPRLALAMIERAVAAKVVTWVAADSVYGVGEIEMGCGGPARATCSASTALTPSTPGATGRRWPARRRRSPRQCPRRRGRTSRPVTGTKGPRLHDWAYLELADLEAAEYDDGLSGLWTRDLLDPPLHCRRRACLLLDLVPGRDRDRDPGQGRRGPLGDKDGRDRQERARPRPQRDPLRQGWHRHVSLVMLAFAMLAVIAARRTRPRPKNPDPARSEAPNLIRWSVQDSAASPSASRSDASSRLRHRLVGLATGPSGRRTTLAPETERRNCNARAR